MTSTHTSTVVVFVANEIAVSHSMWPMIKPPTPATTVPLTCRRSEVDHVAGKAVEALLQRLRQRGVAVHVAAQLVDREVPLLGERELGQQLGHVVADEVSAKQ